jgi:ketosteroid isomerase-like protein
MASRLLLLIAAFLLLVQPNVHAQGPREQDVVRMEMRWRQARIERDIAFLESFYGKELRIQGANGTLIDRDADIALFATRQVEPTLIDPEDMHVALYGDTAIVTGVDHLKGRYKSTQGEGRLRFLDVLIHRDGRWQLVATQGTWVTPPQPSGSK